MDAVTVAADASDSPTTTTPMPTSPQHANSDSLNNERHEPTLPLSAAATGDAPDDDSEFNSGHSDIDDVRHSSYPELLSSATATVKDADTFSEDAIDQSVSASQEAGNFGATDAVDDITRVRNAYDTDYDYSDAAEQLEIYKHRAFIAGLKAEKAKLERLEAENNLAKIQCKVDLDKRVAVTDKLEAESHKFDAESESLEAKLDKFDAKLIEELTLHANELRLENPELSSSHLKRVARESRLQKVKADLLACKQTLREHQRSQDSFNDDVQDSEVELLEASVEELPFKDPYISSIRQAIIIQSKAQQHRINGMLARIQRLLQANRRHSQMRIEQLDSFKNASDSQDRDYNRN